MNGRVMNGRVMNGRLRKDIRPGLEVSVVLKADQQSGRLTRGVVAALLTSSASHPHGVKVRLEDGRVGRVKEIHGEAPGER
jgi:uncharacterized repeat protein (TIGR03833 family)